MDQEPTPYRDIVNLIDEFKSLPEDVDPIERAGVALPIL